MIDELDVVEKRQLELGVGACVQGAHQKVQMARFGCDRQQSGGSSVMLTVNVGAWCWRRIAEEGTWLRRGSPSVSSLFFTETVAGNCTMEEVPKSALSEASNSSWNRSRALSKSPNPGFSGLGICSCNIHEIFEEIE